MNNANSAVSAVCAAVILTVCAGCIRTTNEIKPIHITLDVNLKVDNDLDKFYSQPAPAQPQPAVAHSAADAAAQSAAPAAGAASDDAERAAFRARFQSREAGLAALKSKGLIGEGTAGYLVKRVDGELDADAKALVKAENADRNTLFVRIADRRDTTPDAVGKRRASRNEEFARPGEYYMSESGEWIQKK